MWLIELLLQRWGGAVFAAALKECFCCVRVSVQGVDSRGPNVRFVGLAIRHANVEWSDTRQNIITLSRDACIWN